MTAQEYVAQSLGALSAYAIQHNGKVIVTTETATYILREGQWQPLQEGSA